MRRHEMSDQLKVRILAVPLTVLILLAAYIIVVWEWGGVVLLIGFMMLAGTAIYCMALGIAEWLWKLVVGRSP